MEKDPVLQARKYAIETAGMDENTIDSIEKEVNQEISDGIEFAKQSGEMSNEEFQEFIDKY